MNSKYHSPRDSRASQQIPYWARRKLSRVSSAEKPQTVAPEIAEPAVFAITQLASIPPIETDGLKKEFAIANPHCRQVLTEAIARYRPSTEYAPMHELCQVVTTDMPRVPYVRRDDRERSLYYEGVLKLLLNDIHFLTMWSDACSGANYTVVYAGAAPGHHISFLARLFPSCNFILYDSKPFALNLPPNVDARQEFFTSDVAGDLAKQNEDKNMLFISNVQTSRARGKDGYRPNYSEADMERQRGWLRVLRPAVAMLKFGLPWGEGSTKYFNGTLVLQPYASQASTVSRLVVRREQIDAPEKEYDNQEYEEHLAYHNMLGRVRCFDHGIVYQGLDHCYDCSVFVAVARSYVRRSYRSRGIPLEDESGVVLQFIKEALSSIKTSQYVSPRVVDRFDSTIARSEVRQWRVE